MADCSVKDKLERVCFFQETFLLTYIGLKMVPDMSFLTLSRIDIRFAEREFVWKTYIAAEALPTTWKMKIIYKKKFAAAALNADNKIFVMHVAALAKSITIPIYFFS